MMFLRLPQMNCIGFKRQFCLILFTVLSTVVRGDYQILLTGDTEAVIGSNVTFWAEVLEDGKLATGTFNFIWNDNTIPEHTKETGSAYLSSSRWVVHYPISIDPGTYFAHVRVVKSEFLWDYDIGSTSMQFTLTGSLNGEVQALQKGVPKVHKTDISIRNSTTLSVVLSPIDTKMVSTASSVTYYWAINCTNYGPTAVGNFSYNFTTVGTHKVDVLMVANFGENVTSVNETGGTNSTRGGVNVTRIWEAYNSTNCPTNASIFGPTDVPHENNTLMGFFYQVFNSKVPVEGLSIEGTNWLQHGDILNLDITCSGSPPYKYCVAFFDGQHNSTENLTCSDPMFTTVCEFPIKRYFPEASKYTILLDIANDVGHIVSVVAVNIFNVSRKPQLSVIIVPVACSLVAVFLIVFGVAYYIQSKKRYTIEVADFDFGGHSEDMEYMSFTERLKDSFLKSFTHVADYRENDRMWDASRRTNPAENTPDIPPYATLGSAS